MFKNHYDSLSEDFYELNQASVAQEPRLIAYNRKLAQFLKLDFSEDQVLKFFSGLESPPGAKPRALAYAGHQFGHFVPQLGDGRALLLGEVEAQDNLIYELQLKGSGRTRFSRGGDGKSSLGPVLREYIVSEAMQALGIPTTRCLAACLTGESVYREEPLPGAVSTRVARSHIRVGSFEYFLGRQELDHIKELADFAIQRLDPDLHEEEDKYLLFFARVAQRQMSLIAQWMGLGFIHGVMNTDNMLISGETIDYGPCAFQDAFKMDKVYSSIDRRGRYAYNQQPHIAMWNLSSLANCFARIIRKNPEEAIPLLEKELAKLPSLFQQEHLKVIAKKVGIFEPLESDQEILLEFLKLLEEQRLDFTNSFRQLPQNLDQDFASKIKKRLEEQPHSLEEAIDLMNSVNPYVIPRNHQIEKAIQLAYQNNFGHFHALHKALESPYTETADSSWTQPPSREEEVKATFCGT